MSTIYRDRAKRHTAVTAAAAFATALALAGATIPAEAKVVAGPLPSGDHGVCELKKDTPRQIVTLIYNAVVKTSNETLDEFGKHVSPDVVFKDPVSSTKGWPEYRKGYEQFEKADQLYYKILDWACSGRTIYMNWVFGMKNEYTHNQYVQFEGVSKLVLDKDERVIVNLDNWNEVPPGYAASLRNGDQGGVHLK
ncbi:MAG TPA: nuclear transport factor 2 family protein [Steroidobacteraceae bacterium]|nr:nuclear transport factor 2 family protein [Steroidobacteraceae bacterium]